MSPDEFHAAVIEFFLEEKKRVQSDDQATVEFTVGRSIPASRKINRELVNAIEAAAGNDVMWKELVVQVSLKTDLWDDLQEEFEMLRIFILNEKKREKDEKINVVSKF